MNRFKEDPLVMRVAIERVSIVSFYEAYVQLVI